MSNAPGVFLEAAGHLVCALGLIALLFATSRVPFFCRAFERPEEEEPFPRALFWSGLSLIAAVVTVSPHFVPFFGGFYGGKRAGYCSGAILAGWLGWHEAAPLTVVLALATGVVGGLLSRHRFGWGMALVVTGLNMVAFEPPTVIGRWSVIDLVKEEPFHFVALLTTFTVTNYLFGRLVEYHQKMGERERSRSSDRVLTMASEIGSLLEEGLTPESAAKLVPRIRETLEVSGVALYVEGKLVSFAGEGSLPDLSIPETTPSRRELSGPFSEVRWIGLDDGRHDLAKVALLATSRQPFPRWLDDTAAALRTLICGWLTRLRAEEQRVDLETARFRFLQAQIRPHFLFNTLNTIASLSDNEEVRSTVTNLSGFLRESFRQDQRFVTLEQELKTVERYLEIEKARFGQRLRVKIDCPEPAPRFTLPPFTIQPLVENSVKHGVGKKEEGGSVQIQVCEQPSSWQIVISDDGVGMSQEEIDAVLRGTKSEDNGIGLSNVKERLEARFGDRLIFKLDSSSDSGTTISLEIRKEPVDV